MMAGTQNTRHGRGHQAGRPVSVDTPSPIRGDFIPVSSKARTRSSSPGRGPQDDGLYIHLSLTDSQMDTLASVLSTQTSPDSTMAGPASVKRRGKDASLDSSSRSRSRSPAKLHVHRDPASRSRSKSPSKPSNRNRGRNGELPRGKFDFDSSSLSSGGFDPRSSSTRAADAGRRAAAAATAPRDIFQSIADRRNISIPPKIDVWAAQTYAKATPHKAGPRPIVVQVPPRNPEQSERRATRPRTPVMQRMAEDVFESSSIYSCEEAIGASVPVVSPLHIRKPVDDMQHVSILQGYTDWKNAGWKNSPRTPAGAASETPVRWKSARLPELAEDSTDILDEPADDATAAAEPQPANAFSPFTPYFSTKELPASKTTKKTMIGDNGWLERTTKTPEKKPSPARKGRFLESLKKKAKEMVDKTDLKAPRRSKDPEKDQPAAARSRRLAVTVGPREQSLLYCELEFALTSALNNYIICQFNAGRLEADKLKKVADSWQQKGRPRVVGFRYDLETQLELVRLHASQFQFFSGADNNDGSAAPDPAALAGLLEMMKVNARALRVRTFCQPDTVIAKQLLDAQSLFGILGCPDREQIQLAEVVQFFKTVLEREQYYRQGQSVDGDDSHQQHNHGDSTVSGRASGHSRNTPHKG